jgi:hypothetical protein
LFRDFYKFQKSTKRQRKFWLKFSSPIEHGV